MEIDVTKEGIGKFLEGRNQQKYIVAIESTYYSNSVDLVINDPKRGKYITADTFKPFIWMKHSAGEILYNGDRKLTREKLTEAKITIEGLRVKDENGNIPERMGNGYKYILTGNGSYGQLLKFLEDGGVDVFGEHKEYFMTLSPTEQYLIQTGKRLFKGMDDYNDLHRLHFDIETTGLESNKHRTVLIGVRDNRGFEKIIEINGSTPRELKIAEIKAIEEFFNIIDELKPDIISGYNSENFDFSFIDGRCTNLGYKLKDFGKTLNNDKRIYFKENATLKLGSETEYYNQTNMWGYNVIDIAHAVRRAQAINSSIKKWGLKYITKFSEIAKPNRVYIPGDNIFKTLDDIEHDYAFNDINGDWYKITDERPLKDGYTIKDGAYIVHRYLIDDLWETEQVDYIYNQASFLLSKILPTSFAKSSTMGTASIWKLIMCAWSYEKHLGIPALEDKRDFVGGLSRLLEVGFAEDVAKADFAALYPNTEITHNISPELDITKAMINMLLYIADSRDEFKELKNINSELAVLEKDPDKKKEYEGLKSLYDKKQLPLKILANSFFGSFGAPYLFPWGDTDCAEETTCRGRQYFRLLVRYFTERGFRALVGDSVTFDTPIYIRKNNQIDIVPISELFNENSEMLDNEKLRDYEDKKCEVLTKNGWKRINYVYRHETDKDIYKVTTKDRLVNATSDHSFFSNGEKIKPNELIRGTKLDICDIPINNINTEIELDIAWLYGFFLGDGSSNMSYRNQKYKSRKTGLIHLNKTKRSDWKISNTNLTHLEKLQSILKSKLNIDSIIKDHIKSSSVYNLVVHNAKFSDFFSINFYTSFREKKVPTIILNSSFDVKKSFINGVFASDGYGDTIDECSNIGMKSQIAMAGISLLLKELNIEYKISTRKDKENFNSFILKNHNRNNSLFTNKTKKKSDECWKAEKLYNIENKYVYDISTEDGTFIGGIGGYILKNTDGVNFAMPKDIDKFVYVSDGTHRFNKAGKEYHGLDAVVAEFNDLYMEGRMGLDIDEVAKATINFARKNYADLLIDKKGKTKVKLVGNTIKSKKMPGYIEDFLDESIELLLNNKGYEFIEMYYKYVEMIYTYQIPLVKIASKGRVKSTIEAYKAKSNKKNKAGNPMPKQAHMELVIRDGINVNLGDTIYYVNIGKIKSDGDLKSIDKNKMTKKEKDGYFAEHGCLPKKETELILNCKLISNEQIENNPDLTTDEYNVAKYLAAFNKRITPLLVCFHPDIRNKILIDMVKDKKTKLLILQERQYFTRKQAELCAGLPYKPEDQDTYEDLMRMSDKEIYFWAKVESRGIFPNHISKEDFTSLKLDYFKRMHEKRVTDIAEEIKAINKEVRKLEVKDLDCIRNTGKLPTEIKNLLNIKEINDELYFFSKKLVTDNVLGLDDVNHGLVKEILFKYEEDAIKRSEYYKTIDLEKIRKDENIYDMWLEYIGEKDAIEEEINKSKNKKNGDNDDSEDDIDSEELEDEYPVKSKRKPITIVERNELDLTESEFLPESIFNDNEDDVDKIIFKESVDIMEVEESIEETKENPIEDEDEWNF